MTVSENLLVRIKKKLLYFQVRVYFFPTHLSSLSVFLPLYIQGVYQRYDNTLYAF